MPRDWAQEVVIRFAARRRPLCLCWPIAAFDINQREHAGQVGRQRCTWAATAGRSPGRLVVCSPRLVVVPSGAVTQHRSCHAGFTAGSVSCSAGRTRHDCAYKRRRACPPPPRGFQPCLLHAQPPRRWQLVWRCMHQEQPLFWCNRNTRASAGEATTLSFHEELPRTIHVVQTEARTACHCARPPSMDRTRRSRGVRAACRVPRAACPW